MNSLVEDYLAKQGVQNSLNQEKRKLAEPLWFITRIFQLYMVAYLFLSLRVVYDQSKLLTGLESFVILFAYTVSVALMFTIALLIAIFSI